VVVDSPGVWLGSDGGYHPGKLSCSSENLNDTEVAALANKKFSVSSFSAGL